MIGLHKNYSDLFLQLILIKKKLYSFSWSCLQDGQVSYWSSLRSHIFLLLRPHTLSLATVVLYHLLATRKRRGFCEVRMVFVIIKETRSGGEQRGAI